MDGTWKQRRLGDVVTLQRGFDLPQRDRHGGSIPIVSSSGITGYHDKARVSGPGVVTGRYGTLGEVFYVPEDFWPLNTTLFVREFKGNDPRFISYFLRTLNLASQDAAGAVPGVNRNALHLLPVQIPPLATQRKIAGILSAYDDLIENNTRRIALLEEMAQALYREWFVHFRFRHEQVPLVESALGPVPEGWRVTTLGDVANINAQSLRRGHYPKEIEYIDISSVVTGRIEWIEHLRFADAPGRARRIVRHGDVIWSMVRPNRRSFALILDPPRNLIVSTGFAVITPRSVPFTYLYHALTTKEFTDYLTNRATGAAYPAVTADDFASAMLLLPPADLLRSFHGYTANMLKQRHILDQQNGNLRRTRDLLLPGLVSGEVSVEDLDIADGTADEPGD